MLDSWLDIRVGSSQKDLWEFTAKRKGVKFSKWVRDALDAQVKRDLSTPPQ